MKRSPQNQEQFSRYATHSPDWTSRFSQLAREAGDPRLKAFYHAGVPDRTTPIKDVPLLAMDFETTGLNPQTDGIVSIGIVPMMLDRIKCAQSQHWIIKPNARLKSTSIVIHGITHSDIASAPRLDDIMADLLEAMAGHIMVVHHRGIERSFLNEALKFLIDEGIEFPVIDTMELEARLHRKPRTLWEVMTNKLRVSIRLADNRTRYHLPFYRPHHALTDALSSAELLQAQIATHYSADTPVGELWK